MRLTIELTDWKDLERLLQLLQSLKIQNINVISDEVRIQPQPTITAGDKSINPTALFDLTPSYGNT